MDLSCLRLGALACFVGDGDERLQRVSGDLEDLVIDQWLLVHRDLLRTPRVRAPIDVLVELFKCEEAGLLGTGRQQICRR